MNRKIEDDVEEEDQKMILSVSIIDFLRCVSNCPEMKGKLITGREL